MEILMDSLKNRDRCKIDAFWRAPLYVFHQYEGVNRNKDGEAGPAIVWEPGADAETGDGGVVQSVDDVGRDCNGYEEPGDWPELEIRLVRCAKAFANLLHRQT